MISFNNTLLRLHIWDTAGQEKFRSITRTYYGEAIVALLVYDITKKETFKHLDSWLKELREHADSNVTIVLVGNKCDLNLRKEVSTEEGKQFAKENKLIFLETSAKLGQNVDQAFEEAAKSVNKKFEDGFFDLKNQCCGIKKGRLENINGRSEGRSGGSSSKAKCCGT